MSPAELDHETHLAPIEVAAMTIQQQSVRIENANLRVAMIRRSEKLDQYALESEVSNTVSLLQGALAPTVHAGVMPVVTHFLEKTFSMHTAAHLNDLLHALDVFSKVCGVTIVAIEREPEAKDFVKILKEHHEALKLRLAQLQGS